MNIAIKYLKWVAPFLPIVLFIAIARIYSFSSEGWVLAFHWGAATALAIFGGFLLKGYRTTDVAIAIYIFLWIGSFGFIFNIEQVIEFYGDYKESVFWFTILIMKIVNFLYPKFVNKFISDALNSTRFNAIMVLLAVIGSWISILHNGQILYSAVIPFIIFKITNDILLKRERRNV